MKSLKELIKYLPLPVRAFIDNRVFAYRVFDSPKGVACDNLVVIEAISKVFPQAARTVTDLQSILVTRHQIEQLLVYSNNTDEAYTADQHDCDDYAFALHGFFSQKSLSGICFGLMLSDTHAFNFFVDTDLRVWLVEPRTNIVFQYDGKDPEYMANYYIL